MASCEEEEAIRQIQQCRRAEGEMFGVFLWVLIVYFSEILNLGFEMVALGDLQWSRRTPPLAQRLLGEAPGNLFLQLISTSSPTLRHKFHSISVLVSWRVTRHPEVKLLRKGEGKVDIFSECRRRQRPLFVWQPQLEEQSLVG